VDERIAVLGLGYVGLPLAQAFHKHFVTLGFDINEERIGTISGVPATSDPTRLRDCTFFVVAVPTPVDENHVPDLGPLVHASEIIGRVLKPGDIVVYESTVYPGVTEDVCAPVLLKTSGLARGDFEIGYSPERINPGDDIHTLERVIKVVSAESHDALVRVANTYAVIVPAGLHWAPSIKVAEAAKVIENTQRDLNIALMNELAIIFERIGIRTADVLAAARTKWNFLDFRPGLVGGHCIGVDPYYLTTKAQQLGYQPEVILAGRRINDNVGRYIAQRLVKTLVARGERVQRVGILGMTFKENCADVRNSRVPDIVNELREYNIEVLVHDPLADAAEIAREYDIKLEPFEVFHKLDALVLAVQHSEYVSLGCDALLELIRDGGCFVDVKSAFWPHTAKLPRGITGWSL
jgi:UDP-N-acetyl-D-glucosamine/UDP-N-acetyl-D-galactosamine dehydrogenase